MDYLSRLARMAEAPLLTLGEVARRLGISPRSLSRVIASGELPVVRLRARVVRISPADLAAPTSLYRCTIRRQPAFVFAQVPLRAWLISHEAML